MKSVKPNLNPPITTPAQAVAYRNRLLAIDPNVTYLMTLYLHPSISIDVIREAKAAGITGVKSYPAGVTTNSEAGVVDYTVYYPIFAEMGECYRLSKDQLLMVIDGVEKVGMVLNLHGECPSTTEAASIRSGGVPAPETEREAITILNAEERFLDTLLGLHALFPNLKIVLEHLTTAAAVSAVQTCGPTVAGTITAHHLFLTIDEWAGDPHSYCKPVAKLPSDRAALLQAATSGNPKFFFGSDSAPHSVQAKGKDGKGKVAAGVFTQPYTTSLVLTALDKAVASGILTDEQITKEAVQGFLSDFGRHFYDSFNYRDQFIEIGDRSKDSEVIPNVLRTDLGDLEVVPFRAGQRIWRCQWQKRLRTGMFF